MSFNKGTHLIIGSNIYLEKKDEEQKVKRDKKKFS